MNASAIGVNYAEALFELGKRSNRLDEFGGLIETLAGAVAASPGVHSLLMNPNVTKAAKSAILGKALGQVGAPREFILFLQAVVKRGRQGRFGEIAQAYGDLFDRSLNRVRASFTLARSPDEGWQRVLVEALSKNIGKEVVPSFAVDSAILGGTIVRVGDRVYDGSLKRRLLKLRRHLLAK